MNQGMHIFSIEEKILENRIIIINNEINNITAMNAIKELLYLDYLNNQDITIYLNSPGGSVSDGLAIIDTFNLIKSDVSTIAVGICASMAALILSAGTKGKRFILPNANVMIHQPSGEAYGKADDIEVIADRIVEIRATIIDILAKNTNRNKKQIKADITKDYYMNAFKAIEYGIVDKITGK